MRWQVIAQRKQEEGLNILLVIYVQQAKTKRESSENGSTKANYSGIFSLQPTEKDTTETSLG